MVLPCFLCFHGDHSFCSWGFKNSHPSYSSEKEEDRELPALETLSFRSSAFNSPSCAWSTAHCCSEVHTPFDKWWHTSCDLGHWRYNLPCLHGQVAMVHIFPVLHMIVGHSWRQQKWKHLRVKLNDNSIHIWTIHLQSRMIFFIV